jgi:apolipoprotein N-acyltransferase
MPGVLVRGDSRRGGDARLALSGPAIVLALFVFGALRVPDGASPLVDGVTIRLVQPNVPQREKWLPEFLMRNWRQLTDLTRQPGIDRVRAVVWPEAAPPFPLLSTDGAMEAVGELMPDGAILMTGTQRVQRGTPNRYYNSVAVIDGKGHLLSIYDKSHLVPFGEYLPLFQLLEPLGITQLTGMNGGFSEGVGVRRYSAPGVPSFGVLICYEAIFPAAVVQPAERPDWLVNVTDDSWFGPWSGPYQHLGIARVRAIEEGLPIARAANTGVSAMIDPYGRIIGELELNKAGVLDAALPKALKRTVYSFAGDIVFVVFALVLLVVAAIFSRSTP